MLIRRVARPMLAATFIARGADALRNPKPATDSAQHTMEGLNKLPEPVRARVPANAETLAQVTAAVQIGAGLMLATGRLPRLSAAALALSVVPGSLGGHLFWNEPDPTRRADERAALLNDVGLIGGLIIASVDTQGRPSLGWRSRRAAHKVSEAVTGALPVGAAASPALVDSELVEKVGHELHTGLHVARERGAELVEVARERGPEIAKAARERGTELAEIARERGPEIAKAARERGTELAEIARERGTELAEAAREQVSQHRHR